MKGFSYAANAFAYTLIPFVRNWCMQAMNESIVSAHRSFTIILTIYDKSVTV